MRGLASALVTFNEMTVVAAPRTGKNTTLVQAIDIIGIPAKVSLLFDPLNYEDDLPGAAPVYRTPAAARLELEEGDGERDSGCRSGVTSGWLAGPAWLAGRCGLPGKACRG